VTLQVPVILMTCQWEQPECFKCFLIARMIRAGLTARVRLLFACLPISTFTHHLKRNSCF
jgi:hypothetical protein